MHRCTDAQNNPDSFIMTVKGKYGVMIEQAYNRTFTQATKFNLHHMTYVDLDSGDKLEVYWPNAPYQDTPIFSWLRQGQQISYKCPAGYATYDKNGN